MNNLKTLLVFIITIIVSQSALLAKQHETAAGCYPAAVYLVRHAEKQQIPGERNPELTQLGHQRAQALSKVLDKVAIDIIFASEYKRTQQTVVPTALLKSLKLEIRDARAVEKLSQEILKNCGKTILVSGHSNTVPALMKALGLKFEVKIQGQSLRFDPVVYLNDKQDYGTLFRVDFNAGGGRELNLSVF